MGLPSSLTGRWVLGRIGGGLGVCRLFVFLRYGGRSIWPVRSEQLAPCTGGSVLGPQSLTSQGSR